MKPIRTWIVVADGARANTYLADPSNDASSFPPFDNLISQILPETPTPLRIVHDSASAASELTARFSTAELDGAEIAGQASYRRVVRRSDVSGKRNHD
jgi:hypothetical protein